MHAALHLSYLLVTDIGQHAGLTGFQRPMFPARQNVQKAPHTVLTDQNLKVTRRYFDSTSSCSAGRFFQIASRRISVEPGQPFAVAQ
jgi:hypothetical protein